MLLSRGGSVSQATETMEADGAGECIAGLALVEFGGCLTPECRLFQPVEGEQRAFQPPQLAQRRGEAVLPRVGGELPQDQGGGHGARMDRGGYPQDFRPMGADERCVDAPGD